MTNRPKKSTNGSNVLVGNLLPILTIIAIASGVFLQTGDNYTPNVLKKLLGLAIPIFLALLFASSVIAKRKFSLTKIEFNWITAWLIYLFFRGIISPNVSQALVGEPSRNLGILTYSLFLVFFFVGRLIGLSGKSKSLLCGLVAIAFAEALVVLHQVWFSPATFMGIPKSAPKASVVGSFYSANPLSFFLGISACALFVYLINLEKGSLRILPLLVAIEIVLIYALILSNSSQGLIIWGLIVIVFSLKRFVPVLSKYFTSAQVMLYGVSLFVFFLVVLLVPISDPSKIATNPYLERLEIYKSAVKIFLAHPLLGVGIESFSSDYGKYTVTTLMQLVDNAHSIPLHFLSTQGILGFLLYGGFITWILLRRQNVSIVPNPEWGFWQSGFLAYALIGIIGIEYPAIGAIAFLIAGILSSLSRMNAGSKTLESQGNFHLKYSGFFALTLSISVLVGLLSFAITEFRVAKNISDLSERKISSNEFQMLLSQDYLKLQNAQLLLTAGQAFIAINDESGAIAIANKMLQSFPRDQRTSVLFLTIGNTWNNQEAIEKGERIRDQLFP